METLSIRMDRMHCSRCVANAQWALTRLPGVTPQSVEVGSAVVQHDPSLTPRQAVLDALERAGYPARVAEGGEEQAAPERGSCCGR